MAWTEDLIDLQTIILLIVVTYVTHYYITQRRLPPGPWGIPILGYLPFLKGKLPHKAMNELSAKYGNVMSLSMGSLLVTVLGDYKAIKEAFVTQGYVFSGRPENMPFKRDGVEKALGIADGEVAFRHRRFILSSLRDFGVGKTTLEIKIMDEIKHYLREIQKANGQPINLKSLTGLSVANMIVLFEFGDRFEYSDASFVQLRGLLEKSFKFINMVSLRIILPWTRYVPFMERFTGAKHMANAVKELQHFFKEKVTEEEKDHVQGSKSYYVQGYLTELNNLLLQKGRVDQDFDTKFLIGNLTGLFAAGSETVTTTLMWGLLYLIKYPEVLKKVQKEIDDVIGADREPSLSDKINMPYTESTICEIQRYVSIVPFSIVHSNMEETKLFGHYIPKGSFVIANIYAIHHDKKLWGDPENFRPERFLTPEGNVFKPEYFIPFSIGKRNCIGEPLAQMEIFLYFTSLLRQFYFQLPDGASPILEPTFAIALQPKPFEICAISRSN